MKELMAIEIPKTILSFSLFKLHCETLLKLHLPILGFDSKWVLKTFMTTQVKLIIYLSCWKFIDKLLITSFFCCNMGYMYKSWRKSFTSRVTCRDNSAPHLQFCPAKGRKRLTNRHVFIFFSPLYQFMEMSSGKTCWQTTKTSAKKESAKEGTQDFTYPKC